MLKLIEKVYEAALDDTLWPSLAPEIARTFESTSTAVITQDIKRGTVRQLTLTSNLDSQLWEQYRSYYHRYDVWVERGIKYGFSKVVASKDIVTDSELEGTEFYDFLRKTETFYVVGSVFPVSNDEIGVLGIHRPRNGANYNEEDKRRVAMFVTHLIRALQINRKFSDEELNHRAAVDTVDRLKVATMVVTAECRVVYANREAESLLSQGDGLGVTHGRITTPARSTTELLMRMVAGSVQTAGGGKGTPGGILAIARRDRLPLSLVIAPFRQERNNMGPQFPAAILFIRDPERSTVATIALQSIFGLTLAEANIATALSEGKSVGEVAELNGTSLSTVRTHVKSILSKTGTNRQAELVSLLFRTAAVLA
jgi:DNA-binding CsgD family transcriptional regulator